MLKEKEEEERKEKENFKSLWMSLKRFSVGGGERLLAKCTSLRHIGRDHIKLGKITDIHGISTSESLYD